LAVHRIGCGRHRNFDHDDPFGWSRKREAHALARVARRSVLGKSLPVCGLWERHGDRSGNWIDLVCNDPNVWGERIGAAANQAVQALKHGDCSLADNSIAGQWRLATRAEWEATILMPPAPCTFPALTNDEGSACWGDGPSSLLNVVADAYWTSSARYSVELPNPADRMRFAWKANLGTAGMEATLDTDNYRIWPVR
jgi:hypothetical protein